jgi:hypothetical protein
MLKMTDLRFCIQAHFEILQIKLIRRREQREQARNQNPSIHWHPCRSRFLSTRLYMFDNLSKRI